MWGLVSRRSTNTLRLGPSRWLRCASTAAETPSLLGKMRQDMMTAQRSKDKARLAVIRSMISEIGSASKGPNPITTNLQVLAMLKKRRSAAKKAAEEAEQAKRSDLLERQDTEITILDEYAGEVALMPEAEVNRIVASTVSQLRDAHETLNQGLVMKKLFQPGGPLEGKAVEKAQVSTAVKQALG